MKGLDVSAPFRQLVERKLWPLAILLLAALAAVPLLLAKDGGETAVTPLASTTTTSPAPDPAAGVQPVVAVADAAKAEKRRNVLGARKDPFRPARGPRVEKVADPGLPASAAKSEGTTSGSSGSASPAPPAPVGPPVAPKKVYELYSLAVRFGDSTFGKLPRANLKRLKAMPSVENPVVIYLGLLKDRKTAVFLVDAKAKVQGDGRCLPHPQECQTLHLRVGETTFFDLVGENGQVQQYQLDIVKVARRKTSDAQAARRARTAVARGGRAALRPRVGRVAGHRYNARTGTVEHDGR